MKTTWQRQGHQVSLKRISRPRDRLLVLDVAASALLALMARRWRPIASNGNFEQTDRSNCGWRVRPMSQSRKVRCIKRSLKMCFRAASWIGQPVCARVLSCWFELNRKRYPNGVFNGVSFIIQITVRIRPQRRFGRSAKRRMSHRPWAQWKTVTTVR